MSMIDQGQATIFFF